MRRLVWTIAVVVIFTSTLAAGSTPSISSLSPTSGPIGTSVTINGSSFGGTQGTSTVTFNGVAATPSSWKTTKIVAPVPVGATTGPVVVTAGGIASNGVTFTVLAPSISSILPASGTGGTSVTINGSNFGTSQGTSTLTFNGVPATPSSWSSTKIVAPVPSAAATGPVVVTVGGLASNGVNFTVTLSVTSLSPTSGPVETSVTITGSGFGTWQGASTVTFNGAFAGPTSWSAAQIVAPVPIDATTGSVVVAVGGQASNGVTFTVTPATITSLSPTSGLVGTSVTITGTAFVTSTASGTSQGLSAVTFNGLAALPTSWTATQVIAPVPPGATTGPVVVVNDGVASNGVAFTVIPSIPPAITSLSPTSGSVGTSVTITGTAFGTSQGTSTVTFNGVVASPTSWGSTQIVAPVPAGSTTGPVVVTVGGQASNAVTFTGGAGQSSISYFYDALGRLIGASDSQSNTAAYSYDAVGNLLSITNNLSSQVTIIGFDPTNGPVGTAVTISGTGLGPTASQDSVSFNGTAATITSATATEIVAAVPSGATTGTITVTAPGGSATSSSSFTVTATGGTPAITSFSPTMATPGTAVAIAGTNFDPTPANDQTEFNTSSAVLGSATQTTISTSVPAVATSGHISVTTPAGKAVSSNYFFVVPPGYTASQVAFAGPLPFSTNTAVNFPVSGQIALLTFDGTAGQLVSLNLNYTTFGTGCCTPVAIMSPSGAVVASTGIVDSGYIRAALLPANGSYTVVVTPDSGVTGSLTLTLYNVPPDVTGTITPGGSPVTLTTTAPGQGAELTFSGTGGQRVSMEIGSTGPTFYVYLVSPGGSVLAQQESYDGVFGPVTLPANGVYTIEGFADAPSSGSITVTLYNVPPDVTGTVTINGPSLPVTVSIPGQQAEITFAGTAGQAVTVQLSNNTMCAAGVSLLPPGAPLNTLYPLADAGSCNLSFSLPLSGGSVTLPSTGIYTVYIYPEPQGSGTYGGSITVAVTSP
jgi:YD repeat-containing protein